MPAGDRAAVRVEACIFGIDAEGVAPGEHLNGEGLVQLEEADVVECQAGLLEHALGRRNRPYAHQFRLDARKGEADQSHLRLEPELRGGVLRSEKAGGGAVSQSCRVPGSDSAACPKRRAQ